MIKFFWFHMFPTKVTGGEPQSPALIDNFVHIMLLFPEGKGKFN